VIKLINYPEPKSIQKARKMRIIPILNPKRSLITKKITL